MSTYQTDSSPKVAADVESDFQPMDEASTAKRFMRNHKGAISIVGGLLALAVIASLMSSSTSTAPVAPTSLIERPTPKPSSAPATPTKPASTGSSTSDLIIVSLLGPPGAGKGALSKHMGPALGLEHVSTGDLIRQEIAKKTPIGLRVEQIVKSGGLIDDETVAKLLEAKLEAMATARADENRDDETPAVRGVILDGFPRRLSQCEMIDSGAFNIPKLTAAVLITMPDDILEERRSGRRICPVCGKTFNIHPVHHDGFNLKARVPEGGDETKCDADGATLQTRPDDAPEIAADRMKSYHAETPAMVSYYKEQGNLISIEKRRGAGWVFEQVRPKLEALIHKSQSQFEEELNE